jgi:hypothetical protein
MSASDFSAVEAMFNQQQAEYTAMLRGQPSQTKPSEPRVFTFQPTPATTLAMNHGTVSMIPDGLTRSMEEEFNGSAFESDYNYVVYGNACDAPRESKPAWRQDWIRDEGHENMTLEDFWRLPRVQAAGLTMAEVAMLRIYATAFRMLNTILREGMKVEHWATSISLLTSAIIKLSSHATIQPVFRSIPNATLDSSVPDGPVPCGLVHVENAFSSSTHDINVAFLCVTRSKPSPNVFLSHPDSPNVFL